MKSEVEILAQYKEFDSKNIPKIKILVSYVKPSFLFKTNILTPIHLGREIATENSKYGKITPYELDWLHTNCLGDDGFDGNISKYNRRIGFLTGTYWAWKNYDKLGNPEYFGSFGYRRLLNPEFLYELENYDFVIPRMRSLKQKVKTRMDFFGKNLYPNTIQVIKKLYPDEVKAVEKYFNRTFAYYDEIYILKKDEFFKFCEWIFPIVFEFLNFDIENFAFDINDDSVLKILKSIREERRDIAYIVERLTGYYLYKLTLNKNLKFKKEKTILFVKKEDNTQNKKLLLQALRERLEQQEDLIQK